jgi:hypothetical protein
MTHLGGDVYRAAQVLAHGLLKTVLRLRYDRM